jgi:hypothetical protein
MTQATIKALKAINWAVYLIDTGKAQADQNIIDQLREALKALEQA